MEDGYSVPESGLRRGSVLFFVFLGPRCAKHGASGSGGEWLSRGIMHMHLHVIPKGNYCCCRVCESLLAKEYTAGEDLTIWLIVLGLGS